MTKSNTWILYKFFILILMLASFYLWVFWDLNANMFFWIVAFFVSLIFYVVFPNRYSMNGSNNIWFITLIISLLLTSLNMNIFGSISKIIPCLSAFFILHLKIERKEDLLDTVLFSIAIIFLISSIAWFFHLIGIDLPYYMLEYGNVGNSDEALYMFENHYLYLIDTGFMGGFSDSFIPRFRSVFIEPGYVGCLCSVILYVRQYKMDKMGWIYLITLILTFSLAGWLISVVGYFYSRIITSRHRMELLLAILIFVITYTVVKNYNGGNNIVNVTIIERLEWDETTGAIAGYNRSSESVSQWFWKSFVNSSEVWFGAENPSDKLNWNDIDWKAYIIRYGIVGLMAYLLYLFYPIIYLRENKLRCIGLFLIYVMIFAQTSIVIHSFMYVIFFILGMSHLKLNYYEKDN